MSVDNLPFLARKGVRKWEIFHAHLAGAIQRRLGADDAGQWQVVGIGGDVVDTLLVKGDADD